MTTTQLANALGAIETIATVSAKLTTDGRSFYAERALAHEARTSRDRAINNPFFVVDWLNKTLVRTMHDGSIARKVGA